MFSPSSFRSVLGATKRVKVGFILYKVIGAVQWLIAVFKQVTNLFRPLSTSSSDIPPEFLSAIQKNNAGSQSGTPEINKMQIGEKFSPNLNQPLIQKNGKPGCSDFQGYAASSCAFFRQVWVLLTQPSSFSRDDRLEVYKSKFRLPKAVQAAYMKPLKRKPEYGLPVCNLQLRSYSARHVEFFADFALRAAYYLNIPASGPVPLPRIVERWTVIRSPFVHKKSKENFERITCRRLIQLQDGHPESVQAWLAFLRKHAFHGVGMKANVFEHTSLDVGKEMDEAAASLEKALDAELAQFGAKKGVEFPESIASMLERETQTRTAAPLTEVRKG
ncbi:Tryptophan--tRNA ligase, mitochondrial [Microsporum canis]